MASRWFQMASLGLVAACVLAAGAARADAEKTGPFDAKGATFLLQRLPIKGDEVNREITVSDCVGDVATVQIGCAFAEVVLGEASFATPVAK
jgi:hypothetical protein